MKIAIFGGSGFVGGHLAPLLASRGHELVLPVRDRERAKRLIVLPAADVVAFYPEAMRGIARHLQGADVIVNLVGILHQRKNGDFVKIHNEFVRHLCDLAAMCRVRRIVHVSSLNAVMSAPSEYLRSKARAEQIVRSTPMRHVIVRPSAIFGSGDRFVSLFPALARWMPVLALPCAETLMQPIAVEDLTLMLARVAESADEDGNVLNAAGPEKMSLSEIARATLEAAGRRRPILELGQSMSYVAGAAFEFLPGQLLSRDSCLSAMIDSTVERNDAARIVGELTNFRAGLARMFGNLPDAPRARARR